MKKHHFFILPVICFILVSLLACNAFFQFDLDNGKDSDGLNDNIEIQQYGSNPNSVDSDGDSTGMGVK